jgi:hypothetical protein
MKTVLIAVIALGLLAGCGDKKDVSFDTLEQAKSQANENALFNAQRYRQGNVKFEGWGIIPNGDSSQMPNCPQGDGWATLTFVNPSKTQEVKVKCSTVSGATGCLTDAEYKTKSYADEDGHCQPTTKVPFPLPKIAK